MARQGSLKGMERESIKEVDNAAEEYRKQRNARMRLSRKEKEAKDALIAVMRKNKQTVYRDDEAVPPLLVTLSEKHNVQVSDVEPESEEDEGGEEEKEGKKGD